MLYAKYVTAWLNFQAENEHFKILAPCGQSEHNCYKFSTTFQQFYTNVTQFVYPNMAVLFTQNEKPISTNKQFIFFYRTSKVERETLSEPSQQSLTLIQAT